MFTLADWHATFILIGLFFIIIMGPCFAVAVMGYKTIEEMGRYPSKTPFIQMGIFWKLVPLEIISFLLLLVFYHIFPKANLN